jgi:hypothetical protein
MKSWRAGFHTRIQNAPKYPPNRPNQVQRGLLPPLTQIPPPPPSPPKSRRSPARPCSAPCRPRRRARARPPLSARTPLRKPSPELGKGSRTTSGRSTRRRGSRRRGDGLLLLILDSGGGVASLPQIRLFPHHFNASRSPGPNPHTDFRGPRCWPPSRRRPPQLHQAARCSSTYSSPAQEVALPYTDKFYIV